MSFFTVTKGYRSARKRQTLRYFLLLSICFFASLSCQHTGPKGLIDSKIVIKAPHSYTPAEIKQVTFEGVNFQAEYSHDSQQIIYVSKNRKSHLHTQIYVRDLAKNIDRRITYQDGVNAWPIFVNASRDIIYASSTDEIKEQPILKKSPPADPQVKATLLFELEPFELYKSTSSSFNIKRLTERPKFEGTPNARDSLNRIVFSAFINNNLELYKMDYEGRHRKRLSLTSKFNEVFPSFSPDGKDLLFAKYDKDFQNVELVIANASAKKQRVLFGGAFSVLSPKWHPKMDAIIFAANKEEANNFELYVYDFKGNCLKRLTYLTTNELEPNFSPDGEQIIFTSDLAGDSQLFIMPYRPPEACL